MENLRVGNKEYQPIHNKHLVLTEHAFIGSGMPYDGDKLFTADTLIEVYKKEGRIPDVFLRPLSLNEGVALEAVKHARSLRYITGAISGFGRDIVDLFLDGFVPVIVLPVPDDTGQVQPIWTVFLTDVNTGKRVENEAALNQLKLNKELSEVFDLKPEKNEMTLLVKSPVQNLSR